MSCFCMVYMRGTNFVLVISNVTNDLVRPNMKLPEIHRQGVSL